MPARFVIQAPMALLLLASGFVAACSDDDNGDQGDSSARAEVERTLQQAVDAYNRKDAAAFLSYWTDEGLQKEFEASRDEITAAADLFFGGPSRDLRSIESTSVKGDRATAEALFLLGKSLEREKLEFVLSGNAWKIDGTEPLDLKVPSDTTKIDVDLEEFAYKYERSKITNGSIAFEAANKGKQAHELVLFKVAENFDLMQALQSPEMPAGIELVGAIAPQPPGDKGTMVFSEALSTGRYIMACFLPDTSDPQATPHISKGMVSEFAVPAQGGR